MKRKFIFRIPLVIILCLFCNGHIKNTIIEAIPWNSVTHNGLNTTVNSWKYKNRVLFYRKHLERNRRSVNEWSTETAYRDTKSNESIESTDISTVHRHTLLVAKFKRLWPVNKWEQQGFFSNDYLNLINEHWLQFPPPSETLQKTLGGLYILFTTVGCWGNVIVLIMYLR